MSRFALFRAPVDPSHVGLSLPAAPPPVRAEPCHIDLSRDGVTVRVILKRHPHARYVRLSVRRRDGAVVMTLPPGAKISQARGFALSRFDWITDLVGRLPARVPFAPGNVITLRGEPCLIAAGKPGCRPRLRTATDGSRTLFVDASCAHEAVRSYVEGVARTELRRAVAAYALRLGVRVRSIQLKDTTRRWGSCSVDGDLSFSWRLALAPRFVLDYLAAHEVTHLRDMSHSPAYWALVEGICPRTDEAEAWLHDNDTVLYRFG
jgi:hypothetical protein